MLINPSHLNTVVGSEVLLIPAAGFWLSRVSPGDLSRRDTCVPPLITPSAACQLSVPRFLTKSTSRTEGCDAPLFGGQISKEPRSRRLDLLELSEVYWNEANDWFNTRPVGSFCVRAKPDTTGAQINLPGWSIKDHKGPYVTHLTREKKETEMQRLFL